MAHLVENRLVMALLSPVILGLSLAACGGGGGGGGGDVEGELGEIEAPEVHKKWGASQDVGSYSGTGFAAPTLFMDNQGRVGAVWQSGKFPNYQVFASLGFPGQPWSATRVDTSTGAYNAQTGYYDFASQPAITLSEDGLGVMAWTQGSVRNLHIRRVNLQSGQAAWGNSKNVTKDLPHTGYTTYYAPHLRIDADGLTLIAWHEYHNPGDYRVWAIRYDVKRDTLLDNQPVLLAGASWNIGTLELVRLSTENGILVWEESHYTSPTTIVNEVKALSFTASRTNGFSSNTAPLTIHVGTGYANPRVAFDSTGKGQLIFLDGPATAPALYSMPIYSAGSNVLSMGSSKPLSLGSVVPYSLRLKVNPNGDGIAAWTESGSLMVSHLQPNASWGPILAVAAEDHVDISLQDDGEVMAVGRDSASNKHLLARRFIPSQGWESKPTSIDWEGSEVWSPRVATNVKGNAVVVWGLGTKVRANRFE